MENNKKTLTLGLKPHQANAGMGEPISSMIKKQLVVSVYLISGIKLQGVIIGQTDEGVPSISLRNGCDQVVYKHAISTICPAPGQFLYE